MFWNWVQLNSSTHFDHQYTSNPPQAIEDRIHQQGNPPRQYQVALGERSQVDCILCSAGIVISRLYNQSSLIWSEFYHYLLHQVGELITGWIHSAMWNNASHLAMITFFIANTLFELGYFYKVTTLSLIPSHYSLSHHSSYCQAPIPPSLDYTSASLAFAMEAFLFSQVQKKSSWGMRGVYFG